MVRWRLLSVARIYYRRSQLTFAMGRVWEEARVGRWRRGGLRRAMGYLRYR